MVFQVTELTKSKRSHAQGNWYFCGISCISLSHFHRQCTINCFVGLVRILVRLERASNIEFHIIQTNPSLPTHNDYQRLPGAYNRWAPRVYTSAKSASSSHSNRTAVFAYSQHPRAHLCSSYVSMLIWEPPWPPWRPLHP